jgi:hypothetical protein
MAGGDLKRLDFCLVSSFLLGAREMQGKSFPDSGRKGRRLAFHRACVEGIGEMRRVLFLLDKAGAVQVVLRRM